MFGTASLDGSIVTTSGFFTYGFSTLITTAASSDLRALLQQDTLQEHPFLNSGREYIKFSKHLLRFDNFLFFLIRR